MSKARPAAEASCVWAEEDEEVRDCDGRRVAEEEASEGDGEGGEHGA